MSRKEHHGIRYTPFASALTPPALGLLRTVSGYLFLLRGSAKLLGLPVVEMFAKLPVAETRNPVLQGGAVSTAEDCLRSSSIGAFGTCPWVEQRAGRFGIVFLYQRENAFRLWPGIATIRNAIGPDTGGSAAPTLGK